MEEVADSPAVGDFPMVGDSPAAAVVGREESTRHLVGEIKSLLRKRGELRVLVVGQWAFGRWRWD